MNEKNEYTIESIKQHLPYYTGKREVSVIKYLLDYIDAREEKNKNNINTWHTYTIPNIACTYVYQDAWGLTWGVLNSLPI